jgi:hypothetical protein
MVSLLIGGVAEAIGGALASVGSAGATLAGGLAEGASGAVSGAITDAGAVWDGTATAEQSVSTVKNLGNAAMAGDQIYNSLRGSGGPTTVNKAGEVFNGPEFGGSYTPPQPPIGNAAAQGGRQGYVYGQDRGKNPASGAGQSNNLIGLAQQPAPVRGGKQAPVYGATPVSNKSSFQSLMDTYNAVKKVAQKVAIYTRKVADVSAAIKNAKETGDYSSVMNFLPSSAEGMAKTAGGLKNFVKDSYDAGTKVYETGSKAYATGKGYVEKGKKMQKRIEGAMEEAQGMANDVNDMIASGKKTFQDGKDIAAMAKGHASDAYSTVKSGMKGIKNALPQAQGKWSRA